MTVCKASATAGAFGYSSDSRGDFAVLGRVLAAHTRENFFMAKSREKGNAMKIVNPAACTIEARGADVRQQYIYDTSKGGYTDEPQRDEEGRYMYSVQVDVLSDCEPSMSTEYLTVHASTAPVLAVTEMHQQLAAENLRLELWRSAKRAGYAWHCDGLRVASGRAARE